MDLSRSQSQQASYSSSGSSSDISLDIQELVLIDVPDIDRQSLQQTVAAELTRLLQTQGVPQLLSQTGTAVGEQLRQRAVIQSDITINIGAWPTDRLGVEIAEAIYRGLGR